MKLKSFFALTLIPQILLVNFIKNNPSIIDYYYPDYLYSNILKINSFIYSNVNIPLGEVLYLILIVIIIYLVYRVFSFKLNDFANLMAFISIVYFIFYSFWGLNYFKTSISDKLSIKNDYEFEELDNTLNLIINNINEEVPLLQDFNELDFIEITNMTDLNVKQSLAPSYLLLQTVSGHFIPFTSESVINFDIPKIDLPVVIFHEYAHQIGYADEAEASFIGFMKAVESNNPNVRYSGYFNALLNLLNEINKNHKEYLEDYISKLNERVISDINYNTEFWSRYSNNYFDKVQKYIYDLYLKSNNQEAGIMTYNKVSNFIIDYYQREELSDFFN
jgi:signal transduction histidine kinase